MQVSTDQGRRKHFSIGPDGKRSVRSECAAQLAPGPRAKREFFFYIMFFKTLGTALMKSFKNQYYPRAAQYQKLYCKHPKVISRSDITVAQSHVVYVHVVRVRTNSVTWLMRSH